MSTITLGGTGLRIEKNGFGCLPIQRVSVQQAGERSGFSDNSHFIRTFGHLTGVTPGRYAKEYQSSDQVLLHDGIRHP